jgi:hypothetical protein
MTEPRNDGGQAFPMPASETSQGGHFEQPGMSLRDWFAGQIMAAALTNAENLRLVDDDTLIDASKVAYRVADAMLKAREG